MNHEKSSKFLEIIPFLLYVVFVLKIINKSQWSFESSKLTVEDTKVNKARLIGWTSPMFAFVFRALKWLIFTYSIQQPRWPRLFNRLLCDIIKRQWSFIHRKVFGHQTFPTRRIVHSSQKKIILRDVNVEVMDSPCTVECWAAFFGVKISHDIGHFLSCICKISTKQWTHKLNCHHRATDALGFVTNGHEWCLVASIYGTRTNCTSQTCGALIIFTVSNRRS